MNEPLTRLTELAPAAGAVLWIATLVLIAALPITWWWRRQPAARHGVLLTALVLVMLSPLVWLSGRHLVLPITTGPRPWPVPVALLLPQEPAPTTPALPHLPAATDPGTQTLVATHLEDPSQLATSEPGPGLPWKTWLAGIWVAGIGIGVWRLAAGHRLLRHLRTTLVPASHPHLDRCLAQVRNTLGLVTTPPITTSPRTIVPFATGWRHPVVVLPTGWLTRASNRDLEAVLLHECAHVVRRDTLVGLLQRWTQVLLWPHPLVHWMNRSLSRAREEICDNFVLRRVAGADYADLLLGLSKNTATPIPALHLMQPRWSLEQRISGLLDKRRSTMTRPPRWHRMAVALCLTAVAGLSAASPSGTPDSQDNPVPDLTGVWDGGEWGTVMLEGRTAHYEGADSRGTIQLAPTGRRGFSGFWHESDRQGGTLDLVLSENGEVLEGWFQVAQRAERQPGHRAGLRWVKTGPLPVNREDEAVLRFLQEALQSADPQVAREVSVLEVLDNAAQKAEEGNLPPEVLIRLAETYQRVGDQERARALYEQALWQEPDNADAMLRLAVSWRDTGDLEQSRVLMQRAVELRPDHAGTLVRYGMLLHQMGRMEEAQEVQRQALDLSRAQGDGVEAAEALRQLAAMLFQSGRSDESLAALHEVLDLQDETFGREHPETVATLFLLGQVLRLRGDHDQAFSIQQEVLESRRRLTGPESFPSRQSLLELALIHLARGEYASAEPLFRRVLDHEGQGPDPLAIECHAQLAELLIQMGRIEEAEKHLKQAQQGEERQGRRSY